MNINEWIHFSIDDVILSFKWIYQHEPESIFEEPMFAKLREWYKRYGLVCSLYLFEEYEGFKLSDLQDRYWTEMKKESSWLRFCWHRRTGGIITDDLQSEINSFKRVKKIICEKAGIRAWTNKVRLHKWICSEELLTVLVKEGIEELLISDTAYSAYNFCTQDIEELEGNGWLRKDREEGTIVFYKTELRLDVLNGQQAVKDALEYTKERLRKLQARIKIHIFCHEWMWSEISEWISEYLNAIGTLKLPLYLNVSAYREGTLYFAACNSNYLYKLDTCTDNIDIVCKLRTEGNIVCKFAGLIFYKKNIWMIPWCEKNIYVYNIEKHEWILFSIPRLAEMEKDDCKYRKSIQDGKYLWLLPVKYKCIVRIDMDLMDFDIFDKWPEEVYFPDKRKVNFRMMCASDGKLFLFRADCSHNIILDMATGEMVIWNMDIQNAFGAVTDGRLYLAPVERGTEIKIFALTKDEYIPKEELMCTDVSHELSEDMKVYSYWYTERSGQSIFFMPHEAKSILLADIKSGKISSVTLDIDRGNTLRPNPEYAMYEVHELEEDHLVVPYIGNKLAIVSENGGLKREITLEIELDKLWIDSNWFQQENEYSIQQLLEKDIVGYYEKGDNVPCRATISIGKTIYEQVGQME